MEFTWEKLSFVTIVMQMIFWILIFLICLWIEISSIVALKLIFTGSGLMIINCILGIAAIGRKEVAFTYGKKT